MVTMLLITTFSLSFAGIAVLVGRKMYVLAGVAHQNAVAEHHLSHDISSAAFGYYRRGGQVGRHYALLVYRRVLRWLVGVLRIGAHVLIALNVRLQKHLASVTDLVRGRVQGPLAPHNASLYLKDIARHKEEVRSNGSPE